MQTFLYFFLKVMRKTVGSCLASVLCTCFSCLELHFAGALGSLIGPLSIFFTQLYPTDTRCVPVWFTIS